MKGRKEDALRNVKEKERKKGKNLRKKGEKWKV